MWIRRSGTIPSLVVAVALAGAVVMAGCGSDGGDTVGTTAPPTSPPPTDPSGDPPGDPADPEVPEVPAECVDAASFEWYGSTKDEAAAKAEAEDRPWRIAREDDESFALTEDFVPGRVTVEIDDGVVTFATIELEEGVEVEGAEQLEDAVYLGLTQAGAEARAEADGVSVRVVRIGDESMMVTMDYRPDRRNLTLAAGPPCDIVTAVTRG